jgi:23S rRNA (adenine2503-C2)-methyltransferase
VCLLQVNLICFNPFAGTHFVPSPIEQVLAFRSVLIQGGRVCTIRDSRGDDEMAACGQLGNPLTSAKSAPILEPPERFRHVLAEV